MPKPSHARASRHGGCEPSGPKYKDPGLPGESLARNRPAGPRDGVLRTQRQKEARPRQPSGRPHRAPRAEGGLHPNAKGRRQTQRACQRPFFFAGRGKSPANEKRDPLGSPSPRCSVRASPPRARATRPGGRRRPSLPQGRPCSTIGAGRLNFRVRYGSGCAPAARAAGPRGALRRGLREGGVALARRPGGRTALEE